MNYGCVRSSIEAINNMILKTETEGIKHAISECERLCLPYNCIEIRERPDTNETDILILDRICFEYRLIWPYPEYKGEANMKTWTWYIQNLWDKDNKLIK